jgi:DNA-binding transcriptional ArsR family regulator
VHAFEVLADPVRRRIVELLADGDRTAGDLTGRVQAEFGISQPAVSRHLRVLREAGFASSEARAQQRLYRLHPEPLAEVDAWLSRYRSLWSQALDALDTELHRGRRAASVPPDERGSS